MNQMIGANPRDLLRLSKQMHQSAKMFQQVAVEISALALHAAWIGQHGETWFANWFAQLQPRLIQASELLEKNSMILETQAYEQINASEGSLCSTWTGIFAGLVNTGWPIGMISAGLRDSQQGETDKFSTSRGDPLWERKPRLEDNDDKKQYSFSEIWKKINSKNILFEGAIAGAIAQAKGSFKSGMISGKGEVKVGYAESSARVEINKNGLNAKVSAKAGLISANGEMKFGSGKNNLTVTGKASVGAEAEAVAKIDQHGINGSMTSFVGAKAETGISGEVAGIGGEAKAGAMAGIGAEAKFNLGKGDDGKLHFSAKIGAALLVGGSVEFNLSLDPKVVEETAAAIGDGFSKAASAVGDGISNAASAVGDGISKAASAVGDGISNAVSGVGNALKCLKFW